MKMSMILSTAAALMLVASIARAQQADNGWVAADDPAVASQPQQAFRPVPDGQYTNGAPAASGAACCPTTTTVLRPVVQAPVVTTYRPARVTYYSGPVTVYRPAPVTYYSPAPVTVYSPVVPTTVYSPVVGNTVYSPVVVGRPVVVRSKVYVPGQPVRNFFRAITP